MKVFEDYSYYYNLFYKDKDYAKEARDVDMLLKKYGNTEKDLIIYGCGTGNHDREFVKIGYRCQGIDISEKMIEVARKSAVEEKCDIQYEVSDIRSYEPNQKYDAVVSLFHVMSYQISNEDILSSFKSARKALDKGGLFLFDAWYGPGVLTDKPKVRIKEVEDDKNRLIRHARPVIHPNRNVVDVNYEIIVIDKVSSKTNTFNESHHMRYFFEPEMRAFLGIAGFRLLANLDCKTLNESNFDSWTNYYIAEAI